MKAPFVSDAHYYAFVALGETLARTFYHIVQSGDAAEQTPNSHREWLGRPGRGGRQHVDNPVRKFTDPHDKYLEKWGLFGLG